MGRCQIYPTSAANTSVELFEARAPLLVEHKALLPDSGEPGRLRGGLGQSVAVRKLYDDGLPVLVALAPPGSEVAPSGLFGAGAGRPAAMRLVVGEHVVENTALGGLSVHPKSDKLT